MGTESKQKGRGIPKRIAVEEKVRLCAEFRSSGLRQSDFCRQKGIASSTLSGWLEKGSRINGKGKRGDSYNGRPGPYSPQKRREAVEAYLKSGMSLEEFGKVWGIVGRGTLWQWVKVYKEKGPKGLENAIYGSHEKKRGAPRSIPEPVREEIAKVKIGNPGFGFKKIKNFLWRFQGVKVSTGTVKKTLIEKNLPKATQVRRKPKRHKKVQRFERARPMQLWQSDITSFVLARHSSRVYLVAFMDDHSRYVVSWGLHLRQTGEIVIEAIQQGIQRFGKPEEVLTDQGRQYYSWRGKSDFGKLLIKEGIQHVVSRSHHPQTLGKCERFWETVGQEFWERVHPQELEETRERFSHFIAHYNHFRPHQGIDGMVPADRFFGLESEVRKALERTFKENELRLAVGETPRTPVFLVGQIGNHPLSLHGEGAKLIFQTPEGLTKTIEAGSFGHTIEPIKKEGELINDTRESTNNGEDTKSESPTEEGSKTSIEASIVSKDAVAPIHEGRPGQSSPNSNLVDTLLARPNDEGGSSKSFESSTASGVADFTAGGIGDGGGAIAPTESGSERRPSSIEKKDSGTGGDGVNPSAADTNHPGTSGSGTPSTQENSSPTATSEETQCNPNNKADTRGRSQ